MLCLGLLTIHCDGYNIFSGVQVYLSLRVERRIYWYTNFVYILILWHPSPSVCSATSTPLDYAQPEDLLLSSWMPPIYKKTHIHIHPSTLQVSCKSLHICCVPLQEFSRRKLHGCEVVKFEIAFLYPISLHWGNCIL